MEILLQNYHLPDSDFLKEENSYCYRVWIPQQTCIVLGNGNHIREAVFVDRAALDKIPIIKRPTGGQAVLLSPKMVIVSAVSNGKKLPFKSYYQKYGKRITKALNELHISGLSFSGISDITLNGRKILGSAMHYSRKRIFYHAVLNAAETPQTIGRYLRFPAITPDYRKNRSHLEFVTSLHEQGFELPVGEIREAIAREMALPPR